MSFRQHLVDVLKINPAPSPYPRMIVCIFSSTLPLLMGYWTNTMPFAIFGGLTGFLLVLNDHMGALGHRLWTLTLTWLIMLGGLALGILSQNNLPLQLIFLSLMVYFIGLMGGGKGAELERAALFGCFQFLAGCNNLHLQEYLGPTLGYSFLGYACVVVILSLFVFLRRHNPNTHASLRSTFKSAIFTSREGYLFAFFYTLTIAISFLFIEKQSLDHGYWAVGTVLIIMRPEVKNTIYRALQRLLGTILGVFCANFLVMQIDHPLQAIPLVGLLAFLGPWALLRSYWLGSFVVTTMILLMIDLPFIHLHNYDINFVRLTSTIVGCGFALIGVLCTLICFSVLGKTKIFSKGRNTLD